jgi:hypothetical protein
MKPKIFYFGCYNPLAATRCLLLEQEGFDVTSATDPVKCVRLIAEKAPEEQPVLLVVCNSCDDRLYDQLLSALSGSSVSIPVIRLDESYPAAWRDPDLLAALIRATIRGAVSLQGTRKPPQTEHSRESHGNLGHGRRLH